jgi:DNA-binding GntR family transcriptional regulator
VVTDPDTAEVGETMDILIGLEQLAATRVAELQPPGVLKDITRIYDEGHKAAAAGDAERYYALNDEFHRVIVQGTGNRSLVDLHEKIMWHVYRERHRANAVEPFTVESPYSHDELVRAILESRPEDAGLAMRKHLETVSRLMLARRMEHLARASASANGSSSTAGNSVTHQ